jgi:hypothetical protein
MAAQPGIVQCTEQPCVAVRALVTMQTLGEVLPALDPEVRRWLRSRGVPPAGRAGHPDGLVGATGTLLGWAAQQSLAWDVPSTPDGGAAGLPPGDLSRRTRPGHERAGSRARIPARRLVPHRVILSGAGSVPGAGRCRSTRFCQVQE